MRGLEAREARDDASGESADAGTRRVLNGIRQAIIEGMLRPGQRLTETDIMEEYQASRGAARSALGMLVGEGLVERVLYQGARVRRASLEEMVELTEIRAAVEGMMAARAAARATDEEIRELQRISDAMASSVQQPDFGAYNHLNQLLHRTINRIADQAAATELVERLRSQSGIMHQYRLRRIPGRSAESALEHAAIVAAIADRNPGRAEAAMRQHLMSLINAVRMATSSLEDLSWRPEERCLHLAEYHDHRGRVLERGVHPDRQVRRAGRPGGQHHRGNPVSLASASAMKAAPDSCRVDTSDTRGSRAAPSRISRNDSPGTV